MNLKHFMVRLCNTSSALPPAPEVSWFCCRGGSGLCNLQPKSIILREFTVSDYMASALGRLETHQGNATLHGFLYIIDPCIQSFNAMFRRTSANIECCLVVFLM
ncbi:hypothetical protein ATANTOWER_006872 [Ataeniobius toweri]|uniref:Uncharacterized protein n=1 Tax=Ataeniobius toweri TaxID=208326 RepID=A0ABU7APX7_9TELE|nr:hypothetical protein [Ataeniobius toweri]